MSEHVIQCYQVRHANPTELTELCTSQHPNHKVIGQVNASPLFWQAWCSICDMSCEIPNPHMEPDYLAAAIEWSIVDERYKRQRRANRRKLKLCPHCGGVL